MLVDVKHAVRALKWGAAPLVVSVLSLSLGIAATATMLSVVDAIDFRPLPFRHAGELVEVVEVDPALPNRSGMVSPGVYLDWKERTRSMAALAAASSIVASLQEGDGGLDAARVSDNFFLTVGIQPTLGRVFSAEEVRQRARVAVISYDVWQSRLGGDPRVLGRTVPLSWAGEYRSVPSEPYTIVGVLPRGVRYPQGTQVWIPAPDGFGDSHSDPYLTVTGRLDHDVSLAAARAEFESISAQLSTDFPEDYGRRVASVSVLREAIRASVGDRGAAARFLLLGVAAFVLLLTVLNVAGMFLARTAGQARELRTRLALGAPRSRLATLLLTQSLTISAVAGAAGIAISHWFLQLVSSRLQVAESGIGLILDARFVFVALLLSLVAGVLVAVLPLWTLTRLEEQKALGTLSARVTSAARTGHIQRSMVVAQVALAVTLLSGAGLLSTEFLRLVTSDTGFDPKRLVVASLPIGMAGSPQEAITQAHMVEQQIAELGNISSVALGSLPAEGYTYRLENGETLAAGSSPMSYRVSPGYFETLRIGLNGREFHSSDRQGSLPVAIVNRLAASLWWPNQDPIGTSVYMARRDRGGEWVRVVGVADNERVRRNMTSEIRPVLYRPFSQLTGERRLVQVFARTEDRPEASFSSVARVIQDAYGGDGFRGERVVTMERVLGATLAEQRFRTWALSLFSAVALFLAAMGIYGVVATVVAQRTAEFGVRIALGARPVQVVALVFRQGIALAAAGFALGLAGAVGMTRVFQSLLVTPTGFDARMPLTAGVMLAGAVFVACYFPARRAARTDSAQLLHDA